MDGAPNVFVETIKRGDEDTFDKDVASGHDPKVSVVLRLYEAYGGHAQALLKIGHASDIEHVYSTNLLEDEEQKLHLVETDERNVVGVKLNFRGFEVKTLKIVLKNSKFFQQKGE